jgi:hypothetical protein
MDKSQSLLYTYTYRTVSYSMIHSLLCMYLYSTSCIMYLLWSVSS